MKLIFLVLLVLASVSVILGQYERCDTIQSIQSIGQSVAINYPGRNPAGTSCRFLVTAPVNSLIEASCSFTVQVNQLKFRLESCE
jgi:hypothetical protein